MLLFRPVPRPRQQTKFDGAIRLHVKVVKPVLSMAPITCRGFHFDIVPYHPVKSKEFCIMIQIVLKFVPSGPIKKSALIYVKAWHRADDKPLRVPMMT